MNKRKLIPMTIELVGIAVTGTSIGIDLATHADIGWVTVIFGICLVG
jgi:hypothetical protein